MKIAIVLNAVRVPTALLDQLKNPALAEKYNLTYDVFVIEPKELENFLVGLNYQTYSGLLVGGGDGTVRTVAQVLCEQDIPIIILPLGSFNFLAKSLNYPNELEAAFDIIKNQKTKKIDLGDINGHIFINHAWIGLYYQLLRERKKHRSILGRNRFLKLIFNITHLFNVLPFHDLEFKGEDKLMKMTTCLVYISNNDQYTNLLDFSDRKSLSHGLLAVYIFNGKTRWELFKCILSVLNNSFEDSPYITKILTDDLIINSKQALINSVIDGELLKLQTPLHYTVHKKQLTVFIP